ncbi:MAG TPA: MFS transporter [Bryobacteraceae bacterium]|nr:MFS transporter [Bryobacteraceae bacterium]
MQANPMRTDAEAMADKKYLPQLRWLICGLLFFASTINYIDRQVLGLLKPVLEKDLGWNEADYGWIVSAFQIAYGLMMPIAGRVIDWLGVKLGYTLAVIVWSVAAMGHAMAGNAFQFSAARFSLGIGESANFPAAIKAVAHWFPKRERAFATGIFNSGTNIGALVAPWMVPILATHYGWRSAFVVTGSLGFLWIILWVIFFNEPERHKLLSPAELELIRSDNEPNAASLPYSQVLGSRAAWAFIVGKFFTDPIWWFYLFWLPGFLASTYKLDLSHLGLPIIVVYFATTVGSVFGGWLSSTMIRRGYTVNRARKTAMLTCALAVTSAMFVGQAGGNLWLAVTLISIAAASHQGWSANLFTLPSDMLPKNAVGSVVGLGGMFGALSGALVAPAIGYWLDYSNKSYGPLFIVAGSMYLIALGIIHLIVPKIEQRA